MTYDPAFDDPWLKWAWAVRNAKALHAEVTRFLKDEVQPPWTTRQEYNSKLHGFSVFIDSVATERLPDIWGLRVGDIIHAYRSCLDHLAWVLVDRGRTPTRTLSEKHQRGVYFPIAPTRENFRSVQPRYLPGCRRADIAKVRLIQPYNAGKRRVRAHPMSILSAFSDTEKHRTIQPVRRYQEDARLKVTNRVDCVIRRVRVMPDVTIEVNAELARVYARRTGPNPDIEMKGGMAVRISVGQGLPMEVFLNTVQKVIGNLLVLFSEPPDKLMERAIPV